MQQASRKILHLGQRPCRPVVGACPKISADRANAHYDMPERCGRKIGRIDPLGGLEGVLVTPECSSRFQRRREVCSQELTQQGREGLALRNVAQMPQPCPPWAD